MSCFFVLSFFVCFVIWWLLFFCNDFCLSWVNKTAQTGILEYKKNATSDIKKKKSKGKKRKKKCSKIVQSSFSTKALKNKTLQPFQFSCKNGSVYYVNHNAVDICNPPTPNFIHLIWSIFQQNGCPNIHPKHGFPLQTWISLQTDVKNTDIK